MCKRLLCFVIILFTVIVGDAQIIPADSAINYVDQTVTVYGPVVDGRYLSGSNKKPTLLNIGAKYPNQKMTVVIYGESRGNFGYQPEVMLLNKIIYVKGKVQLYGGKPQIVVSTPFEITFNPPGNLGLTTATAINYADNNKNNVVVDTKEKKKSKRSDEQDTKLLHIVQEKKVAAPGTAAVQNAALPEGDIVLGSSLTIKGGPGNKFTSVGSLKKGTVIRILSSNYGWAKVAEKTSANPMVGYVKVENIHKQ